MSKPPEPGLFSVEGWPKLIIAVLISVIVTALVAGWLIGRFL
jgi:hypothetical protein